jgi:hypothetical protein
MLYLRAQNLMRTDISVHAQVHMIEAIAMGFIVTDSLLPAEYQLGDEARADLAAETVKRVFARHQFDQIDRSN